MKERIIPNDVEALLDAHKNDPGVDVHKLKPGTKIKVHTINSLYEFEVTDKPGYLLGQGGEYIKTQQKVYLNGSTYSGSMIKIGWIGQDMNMELFLGHKRKLTTSNAREATIIGEGWEYTVFKLDDCA
jgi:hypothetical protein